MTETVPAQDTAVALTALLTSLDIDPEQYPVERYVICGGTTAAFDAFVGEYARAIPATIWNNQRHVRFALTTAFFSLFEDLLAADVPAPMAAVVLADPSLDRDRARTIAAAQAWANVPVPPETMAALYAAGITPAEAVADPSLADRDADALAVLAALRNRGGTGR